MKIKGKVETDTRLVLVVLLAIVALVVRCCSCCLLLLLLVGVVCCSCCSLLLSLSSRVIICRCSCCNVLLCGCFSVDGLHGFRKHGSGNQRIPAGGGHQQGLWIGKRRQLLAGIDWEYPRHSFESLLNVLRFFLAFSRVTLL